MTDRLRKEQPKLVGTKCQNCGASDSVPRGMICVDHRPVPLYSVGCDKCNGSGLRDQFGHDCHACGGWGSIESTQEGAL